MPTTPTTTIIGSKFHEVWDSLVHALLTSPDQVVSPRGIKVQERTAVTIKVENGLENVLVNSSRDLNYRIMVSEWLWIALGRADLAPLLRYNKRMAEFSDNSISLYGAYGQRLGAQLRGAEQKLAKDPDTRQACAVIWNSEDVFSSSKDIPCTLSLQWLIRQEKLNCIVSMRSSDVWLGLPYDFFVFSQLTNMLAARLKVPVGWLCMHLGSSHLYETNIEAARSAITDWKSYTLRSLPLEPRPPMLEPMMSQVLDTAIPDSRLDEPWYSYGVVLAQPTKHDSLKAMKTVCDPNSTVIS